MQGSLTNECPWSRKPSQILLSQIAKKVGKMSFKSIITKSRDVVGHLTVIML